MASVSIERVKGVPRYVRVQTGSGDTRQTVRHPVPSRGEREAKRMLLDLEARYNSGTFRAADADSMTVERYFEDHYIPSRRNAPKTIARKKSDFKKHVQDDLGAELIAAILPTRVQKWRNTLDGHGLMEGTQRLIYQMLQGMWAIALEDGYVTTNPFKSSKVDKPKGQTTSKIKSIWSAEWVEGMRLAMDDRYRVIVTLGSGMGLRAGEIDGLCVCCDVDLPGGVIHVNRKVGLADLAPKAFYGPPKTKHGTRTIPLPPGVRAQLEAHLDAFPAVPVTLPYVDHTGRNHGPQTHALVVTTPQDHHVNHNVFLSRKWRPARRALGIPDIPENGCHALRHFYASRLINNSKKTETDFARIARWLGHSSADFTIKRYLHELAELAPDFSGLEDLFPTPEVGTVLSEPIQLSDYVSQKRAKVVDLG